MTWPGWEKYQPPNATIAPKRSKYGAIKAEIDGVVFASQREARRYLVLREECAAGLIRNLELQPKFPLHVVRPDGVVVEVGIYRADFRYQRAGVIVIEDAKSPATRTAIYMWKKKHMRAEYGIDIIEV